MTLTRTTQPIGTPGDISGQRHAALKRQAALVHKVCAGANFWGLRLTLQWSHDRPVDRLRPIVRLCDIGGTVRGRLACELQLAVAAKPLCRFNADVLRALEPQ